MARTPRQKRKSMARKIERMMPANPRVESGEVTVSARDINQIKRLLGS